MTEGLRLGASWTGVGLGIFAGMNALLLWPAGRFTDSRGRRPVLIAGTSLSTVGLALLVLPPTLWLFLVAMGVTGAGSALLTVAPAAVVGDVAPPRSGSVVAAFQMASDVGAMIGPLLANALVDAFGYSAGFGVTAVVMAVAAILAVTMPETRDRRSPAPV